MSADSFGYTIADDWGQRTAMVTVTVGGSFVQASDDAASTTPGTAVLISPLNNDQFSAGLGPLIVAPGSVTAPSPSGTAAIQANQRDISYSPVSGFVGSVTFNYDAQSSVDALMRSTAVIRIEVR